MVHAADRDAAIDRLRRALDETEIAGIQTTLPFDRFVARHPGFRAGDLSIEWVGGRLGRARRIGRAMPGRRPRRGRGAVAERRIDGDPADRPASRAARPESARRDRLGGRRPRRRDRSVAAMTPLCASRTGRPARSSATSTHRRPVTGPSPRRGRTVDRPPGIARRPDPRPDGGRGRRRRLAVRARGRGRRAGRPPGPGHDEPRGGRSTTDRPRFVPSSPDGSCPWPSRPGDAVVAGQRLLAVEAMKMENELRSPRAGTVDRVAIGRRPDRRARRSAGRHPVTREPDRSDRGGPGSGPRPLARDGPGQGAQGRPGAPRPVRDVVGDHDPGPLHPCRHGRPRRGA